MQEHYSITIDVNKPFNEVYHAINEVPFWWTVNFEGSSSKIGDEFTVTFAETYIKLKVLELRTNVRIAWE